MKKKPISEMRIGAILIAKKLITPPQLGAGLKAQLITGTRLGTALVQLGALGLKTLGACLAAQHEVPCATEELLEGVDEALSRRVPGELCTRHKLIPFRLEQQTLHLAMLDPREEIIEAMATVTGLKVMPYVVPELRLMYLLERWHGQTREPRFLRTPPAEAPANDRRRYVEPSIVPAGPGAAGPGAAGAAKTPRPVRNSRALLPAVGTTELPIVVGKPVRSSPVLDRVLARLERAASGEEIARQLVQPVLEGTAVGVLFTVKGSHAVGFCSDGSSVRGEALRRIVMPLQPPSMLRSAHREQSLLVAHAGDDWMMQSLADQLGLPALGDVAVTPVILDGAVVALSCLMAPRGTQFSADALDILELLSESATAAYRRLMGAALSV